MLQFQFYRNEHISILVLFSKLSKISKFNDLGLPNLNSELSKFKMNMLTSFDLKLKYITFLLN